MSVVNDLEAALLAMQNGKPPGVSGSKINFITELSVNHVQVLLQPHAYMAFPQKIHTD